MKYLTGCVLHSQDFLPHCALLDLLGHYACVAIVHNVSKTGVTFPHCIVLMRMITMNETVMILREGKMGRIIMMMKVIIAAIYLCRADVVAQPRPPLLSLAIANDLSLKYAHALHARLAQTQFISWLAATG